MQTCLSKFLETSRHVTRFIISSGFFERKFQMIHNIYILKIIITIFIVNNTIIESGLELLRSSSNWTWHRIRVLSFVIRIDFILFTHILLYIKTAFTVYIVIINLESIDAHLCVWIFFINYLVWDPLDSCITHIYSIITTHLTRIFSGVCTTIVSKISQINSKSQVCQDNNWD